MTEISPEQWLAGRLQEAGMEPAVPVEYGAKPLIEHAARVDQPALAWLEHLELFVRALHSIPLDFWSPIHFIVPCLAGVAGDRPQTFGDLLRQAGELLSGLHQSGVALTRTEQYGIRAAAEGLGQNDRALETVMATARRLARRRQDPGWLMQAAVPELWNAANQNDALFSGWLHQVEAAADALTDIGISVGYPFATGLAALAGHGASLAESLAPWLEKIVHVSRSLSESGLQPYSWFEYGLPGLGPSWGFPAAGVTRALDIALHLADRGIHSGDLLQASFGLAGEDPSRTVDAFLETADHLARSGIDPFFVLTGGLAQNAALLTGSLDGPGGLDRVLGLAQQLHAHGCSLRKTFEDGLPVLREMDDRFPGLFRRGFELAEQLAQAGIDPGMVLAWGMPRALAGAPRRPWLEEECIAWAGELAAAGVDPEPALSYAVPPMLEMAGTDAGVFRRLRAPLQDFIAMLARLGITYRDVLFYDIGTLAENQAQESEAFISLLGRLGELVRLLAQSHLDPGPVLLNGLPAAARAGVRRPWVLEASLDAGIRLAAAGRDPGRFLEQAAAPLAEAAGKDEKAFQRMCIVVEKRMRNAPDTVWPAVQAAAAVSDGRAEWLDDALGAILQLLPGEHETEDAAAELIRTLPQLSAMAADPKGLAFLMEAFRSETKSFGDLQAAKGAWLTSGIEACVVVAGRDHVAGASLMRELALLSRTWGDMVSRILRHGALAAAEIAGHDPRFFLDAMMSCAAAAGRLKGTDTDQQDALPRLVAVAAAAGRARREQWTEALELQSEVLSRPGPDHARLLDDLAYAEQLLGRWAEAWGSLITPLLRTHGRYAGSLLYVLTQAPSQMIRQTSDLDVLRDLVTQTGVRALDILCNLVIPAVSRGIIASLTDHRESLPGFVRDVACWDADLYSSYWQIVGDKALSPSERRSRIKALRDGFTELTDVVRSGSVTSEQERHPHFVPAMAYVFPPSVSVTLQSYEQLYALMADRPQDVLARDPGPDLRRRVYSLDRGSWQLRAGAVVSVAVWAAALAALRAAAVDGEPPEPPALLGWDLLRRWGEGRLGRAEIKAELWPRLLRLVRSAGVQLPQEAGTAAQLQEIKRVFSDGLRDAVEEALLASRREDLQRYDRLVREKMTPKAQAGLRLVRSIWHQIEAYRSRLIGEEEAARRLFQQLRGFAVEQAAVLETLKDVDSVDGVRTLLERIGPRQADPPRGREVQRMHAEVAGQELKAMHQELFGGPQHTAALEYRAASMELTIACEVTKRRAHAAVGFTEGVCVATDVQLWNNPDFLQVVFWDPHGICRGGMHLLVAHDGRNGYLTLPGINPSSYLLEMVEASMVLDMACDYAWRMARAWGLNGVWIPAPSEIASNRQAMRDAIARRRWESRPVRTITFSYEPFAYSFSQVLNVPQSAAQDPAKAAEAR